MRFDPPLQQKFRQVLRAESLPQIRRNLWIALVVVVGFSLVTQRVLDPAVNRQMGLIRLAMFGPLACLIAAPIFGVGVAVLAVLAALQGVNLISTVVIMTIFIYFMLGMLFRAALAAALLVFLSYLIAAAVGHESLTTTHMYVEADLAMKERALKSFQPAQSASIRYRPTDRLLHFLQGL